MAAGGWAQPTFFKQSSPVTLADLAALTGAELADSSCAGRTIAGTAALDRAGAGLAGRAAGCGAAGADATGAAVAVWANDTASLIKLKKVR